MAINAVKTNFSNMSFTPDVPASALGANEYNVGLNVETDTRGVRPVAGDEWMLSAVPGFIVYVTAGFRDNENFHFIVGTREGRWYDVSQAGISNITPGYDSVTNPDATLSGYSEDMMITDAWNGTILFINDGINAPMYITGSNTTLRFYDQSYADQNPNTYTWNYYAPTWTALRAGFMRVYSTPNVGSILIAGNLEADLSNGTTMHMPNTIRWSQAFGLNSGPITWEPTLTNVANELEIPVRGPAIDGFPLNGNFYICSYWDTVVFSPIAYQSSSAPVLGVKLINQGRGLLNENCWCNADDTVYGLDARDIWVFNGGDFQSLGNQRVKDYFFKNLNPEYAHRTFLVNNTAKNQIEIYYPDLTSAGWCNKMLSYRYDLKIFNAPRDISNACHAVETPRWIAGVPNSASRTIAYAQGDSYNSQLVQKDTGTSFLGDAPIPTLFQRDNISFGQPYSAKVQVHRVLPEVVGTGTIDITVGGADSVGSAPAFKPTKTMTIDTVDPWVQIDQNDSRMVTVKFQTNSATDTWHLTAANWQITQVEDTR